MSSVNAEQPLALKLSNALLLQLSEVSLTQFALHRLVKALPEQFNEVNKALSLISINFKFDFPVIVSDVNLLFLHSSCLIALGSVGSDVIWLELQLSDSNELGSVGNDDKLLL